MSEEIYNSVLAKKLSSFIPLSPEELKCLADIQSPPRAVRRGWQLIDEGEKGQKAFVVHAGWGCSYKDLVNGQRQIISFPIAGDCIGLRSILLRTADHSVASLTDSIVSPIEGLNILRCVSDYPRIGTAILWAASRDEAMVVDHLVNVGRRTATERTAHFFMELNERLTLIGHATGAEFRCPLSQFVLADALGLSAIHVNRVLRELREAGLLTVHKGFVKIHDLAGLRRLSGYQSNFLEAYSEAHA